MAVRWTARAADRARRSELSAKLTEGLSDFHTQHRIPPVGAITDRPPKFHTPRAAPSSPVPRAVVGAGPYIPPATRHNIATRSRTANGRPCAFSFSCLCILPTVPSARSPDVPEFLLCEYASPLSRIKTPETPGTVATELFRETMLQNLHATDYSTSVNICQPPLKPVDFCSHS